MRDFAFGKGREAIPKFFCGGSNVDAPSALHISLPYGYTYDSHGCG